MATKVVGTAIFGGIGLLITVGMFADGKRTHTPASSTLPGTPANVANVERSSPRAVEAEPVTESCLQLAQKFGVQSKLSDLQKEELWKSYAGKSFAWSLKITEVSSGILGGFSVQATCAPNSPSMIQDVIISYDSDAKSFVMGLEKDNTYTLKGVLKHSSSMLGVTADGVP